MLLPCTCVRFDVVLLTLLPICSVPSLSFSDMVTRRLLASLDDAETRWACEAERAVLRTLQGGCKVPIAIRTNM